MDRGIMINDEVNDGLAQRPHIVGAKFKMPAL
jgi:hypothetical protein